MSKSGSSNINTNAASQPYPAREGRRLEFKEILNDYKNLCRTVVAFSNDLGGEIIIGVRDKTAEICGLPNELIDKYLEEIPRAVYDAISPYCLPQITTILIEEHSLIKISVFPGQRKPYYIKAEGLPKGVYVRVGAHTKKASAELLEDLVRDSSRRSYDIEILPNVSDKQLSSSLIKNFYNLSAIDTKLLEADQVIALDSITHEFKATVAGAVFFHPEPVKVLPGCEVLFTEFSSEDFQQVIRTLDLTDGLASLSVRTLDLLLPILTTGSERKGLALTAKSYSVPKLALREAILNALIHRKYNQASPVKVAVFSDRVEIFSPGNFPGPIDIHELGNGMTFTRNPALQALARKAGLVEKRGLGFRLMFGECAKNGNPAPTITEGSDYVKVTFWRKQENSIGISSKLASALPKQHAALAEFATKGIPLKTSQAAKVLAVSKGTARKVLEDLVNAGLMRRVGRARSTEYWWT